MFDRTRDVTVEESVEEAVIIDLNSYLPEHHDG